VALADYEQLFTCEQTLNRAHNQHLLKMLDSLFAQADLQPTDVALVAFGCGPGSFTGVRIAAAVTQAIAFASGAMVLPVASSRVLALTACWQQPSLSRWVCCIHSRGEAYYLAAYAAEQNNRVDLACLQPDELVDSPPAWLRAEMGASLIGTMPRWLPASIEPAISENLQPSAEAMVEWARRAHQRGESLPAAQALPTYVAGDSPWRKRGAPNALREKGR